MEFDAADRHLEFRFEVRCGSSRLRNDSSRFRWARIESSKSHLRLRWTASWLHRRKRPFPANSLVSRPKRAEGPVLLDRQSWHLSRDSEPPFGQGDFGTTNA